MMKLSEMNGTQKKAYKNIKACFDYEVGGWLNCIYDGCEEYIPATIDAAKEAIYDGAINCTYGDGFSSIRPTKEVRFAGSEFINEVIDALFEEDGDIEEIAAAKEWFKKEEETMNENIEITEVKDELTGEVAEIVTEETDEGLEVTEVEKEEAPEVTMVEAYPVEEEKPAEHMNVRIKIGGKLWGDVSKEVKVGWKKIVVTSVNGRTFVFPRKVPFVREDSGYSEYLYTTLTINGEKRPTRRLEDENFRGVYKPMDGEIVKEAL